MEGIVEAMKVKIDRYERGNNDWSVMERFFREPAAADSPVLAYLKSDKF